MINNSELEEALRNNDTEKYISLVKASGRFEAFSEEERTLDIDGFPEIVSSGFEAPWLTPFGTGLIRVYDIRRNEKGVVEFGVGNQTLPILSYVTSDKFYNEWPQ